jgi:hypothetical protein
MSANDSYVLMGLSGHFPACIKAALRRSLRAFS